MDNAKPVVPIRATDTNLTGRLVAVIDPSSGSRSDIQAALVGHLSGLPDMTEESDLLAHLDHEARRYTLSRFSPIRREDRVEWWLAGSPASISLVAGGAHSTNAAVTSPPACSAFTARPFCPDSDSGSATVTGRPRAGATVTGVGGRADPDTGAAHQVVLISDGYGGKS
jgi:hypothetical protein